ncbi:MAG: ParB/RepB/Spo0J family partition protein [Eubacteriales bacterium]|nr:ParB/RepB/Spo0J family partition protein [Eubacteriales bacterium]
MRKSGLGKGLDSLIAKKIPAEDVSRETFLRTAEIEPNRKQPRKAFDAEKIDELAESIRRHGIIQPLVVVKRDGYYEIVAGERRWRAAKQAGLKKVPVVVQEYDERQVKEIALIENIQREDLNPMEEAAGIESLIKNYGLKQEEVAEIIAKSRTYVANAVRLLRLSATVRTHVAEGRLSAAHGRTLLALETAKQQERAAALILEKNLTVRETERLVKRMQQPTVRRSITKDAAIEEAERILESGLGTKVRICNNRKNKGKIEIAYHSLDELERLIEILK